MAARKPSLTARLGASIRSEVPAEEVLARLSASGGVYEDYLAADRLRSELALAGIDPARTSPAESSQLLCTWIAYASVSLAQAFLDAEGVDRAHGGFLSPVSAEQVLLLLREVPLWSARARRAAQQPGYDVAAEVRLPAPLPWVAVEPCPPSHLAAMRQAGTTMLERIEAALADLQRPPRGASPVLSQLRGMAVDAQARLEYADSLAVATAPGTMHEDVEQALRAGVSACWALGQLLARPRLAALAGPYVTSPPYGRPPHDPSPYGHAPPGPGTPPPWPSATYGPPRYRPDDHGYRNHGHHDHH